MFSVFRTSPPVNVKGSTRFSSLLHLCDSPNFDQTSSTIRSYSGERVCYSRIVYVITVFVVLLCVMVMIAMPSARGTCSPIVFATFGDVDVSPKSIRRSALQIAPQQCHNVSGEYCGEGMYGSSYYRMYAVAVITIFFLL